MLFTLQRYEFFSKSQLASQIRRVFITFAIKSTEKYNNLDEKLIRVIFCYAGVSKYLLCEKSVGDITMPAVVI